MAQQKKQSVKEETVIRGSGNVFADIGLPNPEEHLLKAQIVSEIQRLIEKNRLALSDAATVLHINHDDLYNLLCGHFTQYSIERLLRYVNLLGSDVQIVISDRNGKEGEASLSVVTA
jgi:predicted XRE-type DNA-binding protein